MRPSLYVFEWGGRQLALPSYGFAVALAFAAGIFIVVRQGKREGFSTDALLDLSWWLLVLGLVGSRLAFVVLNAGHFLELCGGGDCLAALRLWDGGLVFYGGGLAAAAGAAIIARRQRWRFAPLGDLFAPSLALGQGLGRIGCFMVGCCYGKYCLADGPLCATYAIGSVAFAHLKGQTDGRTLPVHASQLYEAAATLLLFFILLAWRQRQRASGETFLLYVIGYASIRFVVELWRGDEHRRFVFESGGGALARAIGVPQWQPLFLSTSQAVSLALAGTAAVLVWRRRRAPTQQQVE